MTPFVLSQILVGISVFLYILSFQFKSRKTLLLCLTLASLFNALHFFVLGRPGPAALVLVVTLRQGIAIFTTNQKIMFVFLLVTAASFFMTYEHVIGYLALIACLTGTYASFQSRDAIIRILLMFGAVLWIIHNVVVWTPGGIALEICCLISNIFGYWRFHIKS